VGAMPPDLLCHDVRARPQRARSRSDVCHGHDAGHHGHAGDRRHSSRLGARSFDRVRETPRCVCRKDLANPRSCLWIAAPSLRDYRSIALRSIEVMINRRAVLLALTSAALFGLATPVAKALLGSTHPFVLAGLLYLGAGLGIAALRRF